MPVRAKSGPTSFSTNITTAVRQTQKATRAALMELNPAQRKGLAFGNPKGVKSASILRSNAGFSGLSTFPKVTFGVKPSGREPTGLRKVARHEVAHLSGAGHQAIKGTKAESSAVGLRQASALQGMGIGPSFARARSRMVSAQSATTPGFSTKSLRKTISTGSPAQKTRAKAQAVKLGQLAKKLKVDF